MIYCILVMKFMNRLLSIVIPCYNEEENVESVYDAICSQVPAFNKHSLDFEIIYVDDGSSDKTVDEVCRLCKKDNRVNLIELSRNFGKESAMFAGLCESMGDYVSIMDADLQDPPSLLPQMLDLVCSNKCDCAAARRVSRDGEPVIRSFFARKFYHIMNKLSSITLVDGARDFRVMTREMTDAIIQMGEKNRFIKGIMAWVGFKTEWIEYKNIERKYGQTKWSFNSLFKYAVDGIIAFSTKPLAITSFCGIFFFLVSFILIIVTIIRTLVFGDKVSGWPSLVCIIFFVSGIQLFCSGISGLYLSKNYIESKNRPIYIKRKPRNFDRNNDKGQE